MIQNFKPYDTVSLTEPFTAPVPKVDEKGNAVVDAQGKPVMEDKKIDTQTIAQGPMASQIAIKMLGTNGGGYMNANAAHPYENPTPLSNFLQMLSIFAIPSALTYYLGRMVKNQGHGWAVWAAMFVVFFAGVLVCWHYEAAGNPIMHQLGVDPASGNMEGKEVRFGIFNSALFASVTTDASCGAVNAMHDSFTPLGGLIPLLNIELGEIIFGGVGAGLYGMLIFVILAVFIAGLMVGRTPEFLGKKIEPYDVKMAALVILVLGFSILGFSAWACLSKWGAPDPVTHQLTDGTNNNGPHGFSEILYAYSSCTGNNGSAFGGLGGNTPWYNTTLGLATLFGRFAMIVPILALAGSLARKKHVASSAGTFPVSGPLFTILLVGTIMLIGALTYFPALSLGPIIEHFMMHAGKLF
jgi:potassium-transporting ATPase potassium-binding subunit